MSNFARQKFDPKADGFAWPEEIDVTNSHGETMHIFGPWEIRSSDLANVTNERGKENLRRYRTDKGLLTELQVKYWQIGGESVVWDFLAAFNAIFEASNELRPISEVRAALHERGFTSIVIDINLDWLIKGKEVTFDSKQQLISKCHTSTER